MPIEDTRTVEGDVPDGAHMALLISSENGVTRGIPIPAAMSNGNQGARMLLVFDPESMQDVCPVVFAKMNRYGMWFRCNCGQPTCTKVFRYKLTVEGSHPEKR